jgi:PAS domain-containing protein
MISVANKPGGYTEDDKEALVRLASVVDISRQRKRAEEALRQSRTKYHDLYHDLYKSAPVAYFSVGTDGLINAANDAAEKLTGYRLEELRGMKVDDLYAEESKTKAKKMFEQFRRGIPAENEEMVYKRR